MSAAYFLNILPKIGFVILIVGIAFGLCFLFCPMKYDVRASNMDCIKCSIRLDFIFRMISFEIFLKKKEKLLTKIKLCLFGKCVWQKKSGRKKKKPAEITEVQDKALPKTEEPDEILEEKTKRPNVRRIKMSHPKEPPNEAEKTEIKPNQAEESLIKRIMKMPDKGKLIKLTLKFIKDILKEVKPDYVYIRGILGTGDPCSTGRYLGIAYAAAGYFGLDAQITPDFENVVYKGKIRLTGSVRIYKVIYLGLRFITKKPVRNLIKILRNKDIKKG